jgi:NADH-quinone oxidoreductase subunit D
MLSDIKDWSDGFLKVLGEVQSLVADNRIFKQRNVDIGVISKEDAIAWGFTGPCIRASGVAWDLRKSQPYDAYDRMDFNVIVSNDGDCYARFMVRMDEMRQRSIARCRRRRAAR